MGGIALGTGDGAKCRRIVGFGISTVALFLLATTGMTVLFISKLAVIFSSDPAVLQLFADCGLAMGFMIFFMCFSMHFEALLFCLGRSQIVMKAGFLGSWAGQVPGVLLMVKFYGQHLQSVYIGVGIGYLLYCAVVFKEFMSIDLDAEAKQKFEDNQKQESLLA